MKTTVKASVACLMAAATFAVLKIHASQNNKLSDIVKENVAALCEIQQIEGNLYVVDTIPCYSAGIHTSKYYDYIYIDCSSCKKVSGRGTGTPGKCINVRKFNP